MVIHGPNEERKRFEADEIIAARREEFRVLLGIYVGDSTQAEMQRQRKPQQTTRGTRKHQSDPNVRLEFVGWRLTE
jgi:exo-beta-1,3-glucanase (GH17 family)